MARKSKPFRPSSAYIRKEMSVAKRAFNSPHDVDGPEQPKFTVRKPHSGTYGLQRWKVIENQNAAKRQRDLILYCTAIAQKRGLLPVDCSKVQASLEGTDVLFYTEDRSEFPARKIEIATITPRFLDWVPDEPVAEVGS